jgi:hypothetical protein
MLRNIEYYYIIQKSPSKYITLKIKTENER